MAVTMVTLLPWQPLESILNNLKSPSDKQGKSVKSAVWLVEEP